VKLLRNRAFAVFLLARTVSFTGTGVTVIVLPVLVYQRTGSPAAVAALSVVNVGPYLALGLLAGALADRLNRKKMLVISDGSAALLLASIPAAEALHLLAPAQIFVVALGIGTAFVWFDAANFGSLPVLVDKDQLPAANTLIASSGTLALLVGPAIGGALLTLMAPPYALGLDAASYLISGLLIASIRRPFELPRPDHERRARVRSDVVEGLRFLWHQPVIRTMTFSAFCACLSWGGSFGLLVVYATRALRMAHADVRLGLLYTAGELGGFFALVACPVLARRLSAGRLMAAFLVANAAALALLSLAPTYIWAVLFFCCYEMAYVAVTWTIVVVRQMLTPTDLQARVNTASRLIAAAGQPVGAILGGVLSEFLPIRITFGLVAIGVAIGAGLGTWSCLGSGPLSKVSLPAPTS
jgi:predicted MFS family arabinose efflux permease